MSKLRRVGGHDIDGEDHATEADGVEHLRSCESLDIARGRHEDQAERCKGRHDEEALRTTPNIENLRDWKVGCRRHDIADDVDDWNQRVRFEATQHVWSQVPGDGCLERIDKVQQEEAVW